VRILSIAWLAVAASGVSGCGRTALDPPYDKLDAAVDHPRDIAAEHRDAPPDMTPDLPIEHPPDAPLCVPKDETCNGLDDDCNGKVDDNLPAIPCPNGGYRVCVGGNYSECPKRCQVCVPNSQRTCITSFCTFWGSQTCAEDGMSFSSCKESTPPPECKNVAAKMMRSPELEQCCIDNGYCCVDEFDLNKNGNTTEMLGRCEAVVCE
jgi:hypothetical protein